MGKTKLITIERLDREGLVIETSHGVIKIVVHEKLNERILVKINIPNNENFNIYRIDNKGKPQNKKTKECFNEQHQKKNKVRPS